MSNYSWKQSKVWLVLYLFHIYDYRIVDSNIYKKESHSLMCRGRIICLVIIELTTFYQNINLKCPVQRIASEKDDFKKKSCKERKSGSV
jgi:hypothetical protein